LARVERSQVTTQTPPKPVQKALGQQMIDKALERANKAGTQKNESQANEPRKRTQGQSLVD
jgi:CMP-2-keto-3-deoxyoctulosonic acid synthetase